MSLLHFLKRRRDKHSRGQTMVEFAIVVPIFLLIIFGLLDGGRLIFAHTTVAEAARNAARTAAVEATFIGIADGDCSAPTCPASTAAYRSDVAAAANRASVIIGQIPNDATHLAIGCSADGAALNTTNNCATDNTSGSVVTVVVTIPIQALTPLWPGYPDSLTATSSMVLP